MSVIGSPLETSIVQAVQAQQTASKARDRQRAIGESARRFADIIDLRVAGVETAEAVRPLPQNGSEQADQESHGPSLRAGDRDPGTDARPGVDVRA